MFSIQCTKENLIKGIDLVQSVTVKNQSLPILQNIILKIKEQSVFLEGTNLETGIEYHVRGKIEGEGSIAIPAKTFADYIKTVSGVLDISVTEKSVTVKSEKNETTIHVSSAEDFPEMPWVESGTSISVLREQLLDGLQQVVFAAGVDQHRPELQSVHMIIYEKEIDMVSTDGYRLSQYSLSMAENSNVPEDGVKVLIPVKTAQIITRILEQSDTEYCNLIFDEHQIQCVTGNVKSVSRLMSGKYPDYKQILPEKAEAVYIMRVSNFSQAVKSASLFCRPGIQDIKCEFSDADVRVSGSSDTVGTTNTSVPIVNYGTVQTIVFNSRYLQDALQHTRSEYVGFFATTPQQPVILIPYAKQPEISELKNQLDGYIQNVRQKMLIMPIKQ